MSTRKSKRQRVAKKYGNEFLEGQDAMKPNNVTIDEKSPASMHAETKDITPLTVELPEAPCQLVHSMTSRGLVAAQTLMQMKGDAPDIIDMMEPDMTQPPMPAELIHVKSLHFPLQDQSIHSAELKHGLDEADKETPLRVSKRPKVDIETEKPFACISEGCNFRFKTLGGLQRHQVSKHTPKSPQKPLESESVTSPINTPNTSHKPKPSEPLPHSLSPPNATSQDKFQNVAPSEPQSTLTKAENSQKTVPQPINLPTQSHSPMRTTTTKPKSPQHQEPPSQPTNPSAAPTLKKIHEKLESSPEYPSTDEDVSDRDDGGLFSSSNSIARMISGPSKPIPSNQDSDNDDIDERIERDGEKHLKERRPSLGKKVLDTSRPQVVPGPKTYINLSDESEDEASKPKVDVTLAPPPASSRHVYLTTDTTRRDAMREEFAALRSSRIVEEPSLSPLRPPSPPVVQNIPVSAPQHQGAIRPVKIYIRTVENAKKYRFEISSDKKVSDLKSAFCFKITHPYDLVRLIDPDGCEMHEDDATIESLDLEDEDIIDAKILE